MFNLKTNLEMLFFSFSVYFSIGGYIDLSNNQFTHLSQDVFEPIIFNLIANGSSSDYINVASSINAITWHNSN